jgi:RHS repeat-associated protein
LLDDQFKYVASSSGFDQVGADQEFKVHVKNNMPVAKNGYLYVYVSNETPNINVYFDNLQVTHIKGPLLQEQSYYPFGMQMAGISDKAMGKLDSKNKFNGGVELEEDYGVNLYSTFYRQYDPQIGRFNGVDILSEKNAGMSGYHFSGNNPISFNDPKGDQMDESGPKRYIDQYGNVWHNPGVLHGIAGLGSMEWSFQAEFEYASDFAGDGSGGGGVAGTIANPSGFISKLQRLISEGNKIDITNFFETKNGYVYGGIAYNPKDADMDVKVMDVPLSSVWSSLVGLSYNWNSESNRNTLERGISWGETGSIVNESLDASHTISQVANKINKIGETGALKVLGRITGVIAVYDHLQKGVENGDWVEITKGVVQGTIMIFGGEELELAYNLGDLGLTLIDSMISEQ